MPANPAAPVPIESSDAGRLYPLRFQPLLCLSVCFLLGIALSGLLTSLVRWVVAISLLIVSIAYLFLSHKVNPFIRMKTVWQKHFPLSPGWFLLFLALGMLRFSIAQPDITPHQLTYYNDTETAVITGVVIDTPQTSEHSTSLTLRAESIQLLPEKGNAPELEVEGKVRVSLHGTQPLAYGDRLRLVCVPQTPQPVDDFNYPRWLAARQIYSQCSYASATLIDRSNGSFFMRTILSVRQNAQAFITRTLPPDEAALLSGILLGLENEISPSVEQAFQRSGTSHIIAISGANFTLLIGFVFLIFLRRLPRNLTLPAAVLLVAVYALFTGGNPAILRAAFMVIMALAARFIGRRSQGLNSLGFSAGVLCIFNPLLLWDLSFQLSALATLGLVLFSRPLTQRFYTLAVKKLSEQHALTLTRLAGEYLLMSLAAQVFTLPLIVYHFHNLSLSSLLANLLILPVQPLIMAFGALTVLFGLLIPPLGAAFAWLAWVPLTYTLRMVEWTASFPWSSLNTQPFHPFWLGVYLCLAAGIPLLTGWFPALRGKIKQTTFLLLGSLAVIILWSAALNQPDDYFHLTIPDLPGNESILITLPDSSAVLIGRAERIDDLESALQQPLSGYRLQAVLLSQSQSSALDSLEEIIQRHSPAYFLYSPQQAMINIQSLQQKSLPAQTEFQVLSPGQRIVIGNTFTLTVLAINAQGAALLLEYEDLRLLLPGGVSYAELQQTAPAALHGVTALILTASDFESTSDWIALPVQTILLSGTNPACPPEHCRSTGGQSAAGYGAITLSSDGASFWLTSSP